MDQTYGYGKGDFHLDSLRARQERQFDRDLRYFVGFMPSVNSDEILSSLDNVVKEKAVLHANLDLIKKAKLRCQLNKLQLGDIPRFVQRECQIGSMHLKKKLQREERAQEGWESQKLGKVLSKTRIETLGRNFLEFIVSAEQRFPLLFAEGQRHEFFKFKAKKGRAVQVSGASCQRSIRNMLSKLKLKERRRRKKNDRLKPRLWQIAGAKCFQKSKDKGKINNFLKENKAYKPLRRSNKRFKKNLMCIQTQPNMEIDSHNCSPTSIPRFRKCSTKGCFEISKKKINFLDRTKSVKKNRSCRNLLNSKNSNKTGGILRKYGSNQNLRNNWGARGINTNLQKENATRMTKTGSAFFLRRKVFKRQKTQPNIRQKGLGRFFSVKAIQSKQRIQTSS